MYDRVTLNIYSRSCITSTCIN